MRHAKFATFISLIACASIAHAHVVIRSVSLSPNPIGANDSTTITVDGYVTTVGAGQANCTGFEIFFGDSNVVSTDPHKPAGTFVRFQPSSTASFPITVTHQYSQVSAYDVHASPVSLYNGVWYSCGSGQVVTLDVLGDTIQSIASITPAAVNQQTSVIVKGLGSCSQNVQVHWGDNNTSTIAGPVNLKTGGIASHTYSSAGTFTVTADGSTCSGTATTTIGVGLFNGPGSGIDPGLLQNLRDRLDRYAHLPGLPVPGHGPLCPMCDGLREQVKALDQTGLELRTQAEMFLKDLSAYRGKAKVKVPAASGMVKQLDEYFGLRTQLLKLYGKTLEQSQGTKGTPKP
jgi:hypothetical protein